MRKLTKVTASILSAAMIMGTLAGCGAEQQVSKETPTTATTETTVVASTEVVEPVEMTQVTIWSGNSHDKGVMEELVKEFNNTTGKEKGIEIVYTVHGGDSYSKTLDLALQAGEAPDLFSGSVSASKVEEGQVMAYDELPGGAEMIAKYADIIPQSWSIDGKTYMLPQGVTTQGLIYNKDMFKAAGLVDENGEATPPKTWDELREYAKILTNESERQYGIIFPVKWGSSWIAYDLTWPVMASNGFGRYNCKTGAYDFSTYKVPMETILGMKEDGSVYPGADSIDNDSARALFAEGVIGMKFAASWDVGVLNTQFPAQCDWGVAPYPTINENERYATRMSYSSTYMINGKTEVDLAKIEEVIKFFLSDEVAIARYQEGSLLPIDWEIVKDVEIGDNLKGWKEFAEIISISEKNMNPLSSDIGGARKEAAVWLDVYAGNTTVDDAIAELNETMNKGIETYYAAHPDVKEKHYTERVLEDFEFKLYEWDY